MGIPGLFGRWLAQNAEGSVYDAVPPFVASLAFDMNGVFHSARNYVYGDGKDRNKQREVAGTDTRLLLTSMLDKIEKIIMDIVQQVDPKDCVILAVDGVAPGAKLQQQRGRREKSVMGGLNVDLFDRNAITPGTDFMVQLDGFILNMLERRKFQLPPHVIYSSHLVEGEGEHKIMGYYRDGTVLKGEIAQAGGNHVLYGLDADLIILSLMSPLPNIYLFRKSSEEDTGGEVKDELVGIETLKEYVIDKGKKAETLQDFAVMMCLLGNDFLPHHPTLERMETSINMLLDVYAETEGSLTKDGPDGLREIDWQTMRTWLTKIVEQEEMLLAENAKRQYKYPSRFFTSSLEDGVFYPDRFRTVWYQNALGYRGDPQRIRELSSIVGYDVNIVDGTHIERMVRDYLKTMAWIYAYYQGGTEVINQEWVYPWYHAPMLTDLGLVVDNLDDGDRIDGYLAYPGMVKFTALHQLVAVLPLKSKHLLPAELQPLSDDNSIIRDYYPKVFKYELEGTHGDWLGVPIIPIIDRRRIVDAVAQITFTPSRAKIWQPVKPDDEERSPEERDIIESLQFEQERYNDYIRQQEENRALRKEREENRRYGRNERYREPSSGPSQSYRGSYRGRSSGSRGTSSQYTPRGRGQGRGYTSQAPTSTTSSYTPRGGYSQRGSYTQRGGYAQGGGYSQRGGYAQRGTYQQRDDGYRFGGNVSRGRGYSETGPSTQAVSRGRGYVSRGRGQPTQRAPLGQPNIIQRGPATPSETPTRPPLGPPIERPSFIPLGRQAPTNVPLSLFGIRDTITPAPAPRGSSPTPITSQSQWNEGDLLM